MHCSMYKHAYMSDNKTRIEKKNFYFDNHIFLKDSPIIKSDTVIDLGLETIFVGDVS